MTPRVQRFVYTLLFACAILAPVARTASAHLVVLLDHSGSLGGTTYLRGRAFDSSPGAPALDYTRVTCTETRLGSSCSTDEMPLLFPTPIQRSLHPDDMAQTTARNLHYYTYNGDQVPDMTVMLGDSGAPEYHIALNVKKVCAPSGTRATCPLRIRSYRALHRVVVSARNGMPDYAQTVDAPQYYTYEDSDEHRAFDTGSAFLVAPDLSVVAETTRQVRNPEGLARPRAPVSGITSDDTRPSTTYYTGSAFAAAPDALNITGFTLGASPDLAIYVVGDEVLTVGCGSHCIIFATPANGTAMPAALAFDARMSQLPAISATLLATSSIGPLRFVYQSRLDQFAWIGANYTLYGYDWRTDTAAPLASFPAALYAQPEQLVLRHIWSTPRHIPDAEYVYVGVLVPYLTHDYGIVTGCEYHVVRLPYGATALAEDAKIILKHNVNSCTRVLGVEFAVLPLDTVGYTGYASLATSEGSRPGDGSLVPLLMIAATHVALLWGFLSM